MNKTNNTHLFMSATAVIIFGALVMLKLRRHHHSGALESAGKKFDGRLEEFGAALNKVTQFVQHALNLAS